MRQDSETNIIVTREVEKEEGEDGRSFHCAVDRSISGPDETKPSCRQARQEENHSQGIRWTGDVSRGNVHVAMATD